nr:glycosyltransferase family 39 protein [Pseudonocardia sp. AL041005-10]
MVAAVHLVMGALGRGYWFDEALMLAIGRHHLDWGSADQPPVAPALAGLADVLAPGVNGVLRIAPSLATAGAVVVAALIARELGGDRRAQVLTALAQATGLWVTLFGHFLTPYSLEPLQWALLLWLLVRWTRVRDDRLLLAVGPLLGLAALTKFQVILLGAVLVLAIGVAGPRAMLRRPAFWWAALLGALIASPTLVWQAVHGWPQLRMTSVVAQESVLFGGPGPNAVAMLLLAGLLGTVLVVVGAVAAFTTPRLRPYRFVAVTFLVLWIVFAVSVGRAYYLCGLHGAVAALGRCGSRSGARPGDGGGPGWHGRPGCCRSPSPRRCCPRAPGRPTPPCRSGSSTRSPASATGCPRTSGTAPSWWAARTSSPPTSTPPTPRSACRPGTAATAATATSTRPGRPRRRDLPRQGPRPAGAHRGGTATGHRPRRRQSHLAGRGPDAPVVAGVAAAADARRGLSPAGPGPPG